MADANRAELIAENVLAWNALLEPFLAIGATLHDPRECAKHVDAASQQLLILQGNVGLLLAEEDNDGNR